MKTGIEVTAMSDLPAGKIKVGTDAKGHGVTVKYRGFFCVRLNRISQPAGYKDSSFCHQHAITVPHKAPQMVSPVLEQAT